MLPLSWPHHGYTNLIFMGTMIVIWIVTFMSSCSRVFYRIARDSHRKCSVKKGFLKISQYLQEKTCAGVSSLIKKRLLHKRFPVNIMKFCLLFNAILRNLIKLTGTNLACCLEKIIKITKENHMPKWIKFTGFQISKNIDAHYKLSYSY